MISKIRDAIQSTDRNRKMAVVVTCWPPDADEPIVTIRRGFNGCFHAADWIATQPADVDTVYEVAGDDDVEEGQ